MGFHRNLPRSVVFAPRCLGGIGLCNLIHEQFTQQIIILICHLHAATTLGRTMETMIRSYQLWAGLRQSILWDTQPCPWIPDWWLSHLRATMRSLQIQLRYAAWTVLPSRIGDRYLMEDFLDQNLPRYKLERLNACRMYLQVTTLSEIMDNTGAELLPQILSRKNNAIPAGLAEISSSTLHWPHVNLLSPACWKLWTTTICSIYTGDTRGTCLSTPLGAWTETHSTNQFW